MSNLADAFLDDLADLDDDDRRGAPVEDSDDSMEEDKEFDEDEMDDDNLAKATDVRAIAQLMTNASFLKHMAEVDQYLEADLPNELDELSSEYKCIGSSNELLGQIDTEVMAICKFVKDDYALKFPELESLVLNPLDYARVVRTIGNEMDMTLIDLSGVLPSATIMVVTVTGSTTNGKPLPEDVLKRVMDATKEMLDLEAAKKKLTLFIESRLSLLAPNLSAIVGTSVAAQLMAVAGGLQSLAKIPSGNLQALGARKKNLAGLSTASTNVGTHTGFIASCDLVLSAPKEFKTKAIRLCSGKATLAARVDVCKEDPSGEQGRKFRHEIEKRLDKLQEPPPPQPPKPLPAPDDKPRKKRAGKRIRKIKEKFQPTELRKQQNRMAFGVAEDQVTFGNSTKGLGMIGQFKQNGKLRAAAKQEKMSKIAKRSKGPGGQSVTSGLSSSLAFTPVQGLELENPNAKSQKEQKDDRYFSAASSFFADKPPVPKFGGSSEIRRTGTASDIRLAGGGSQVTGRSSLVGGRSSLVGGVRSNVRA